VSDTGPSESNAALIADFYRAFQRRDAAAMGACYAPAVRFSDPVFGDLEGDRAIAMWEMLCVRAEDLRIEFRDVSADDRIGRAHWDAWYTFTTTGRPVHNSIDATFEFADGHIVEHTDHFDVHRWATQALGLPGRVFGGLPPFKRKLRTTALKGLDAYLSRATPPTADGA